MRKLKSFAAFGACVLFFSLMAAAQSIRLQPFLSGLSSPVFITNAKDGTKRLFIVERGGSIKVVQPNSTTPTVFLNISSIIVASNEQGLLGLAFHPQYASNGRFFVYYTRASDGAIQIAEYHVLAGDPNVADATGTVIITIPHPNFTNHNGGTINFGADGFLYAGMGDGGSGNDPNNNAQRTNILLGKIIRINVNSSPYAIPPDNPFTGANTTSCNGGNATTNACQEIYAFGLRNPYRWSFDSGGTHQLWAGDVGQSAREEVDLITNGGNYGWRIMEGNICTPGVNPNCTPPTNYISPVFDYGHTNGRCSIIGGYIYRGTQGTLPNGAYIYGDYCSGEVLSWSGGAQNVLLSSGRSISAFGEDESGELYVVGLGGTVDKLASPTAAAVSVGGRVMNSRGRGIRNVVITMTDTNGNVRTATSTTFGYYRFTDVAAGETYIFAARGKRFAFGGAQVQSIVEDADNINFIGKSF